MFYDYGSQPEPPYDYTCFIRAIAPVLPRNDRVFFHNGSLDWRENHEAIPRALFRNVCHWKSPRRFREVCNNEVPAVNVRWRSAIGQLMGPPFEEGAIGCALNELDTLSGVGVPRASALLTAWNPDQFGIVDFKVLAVLGMPRGASVARYIEFRTRLLDLRNQYVELQGCALRQIELALWHYFDIQNTDHRERPDG